MTVALEMPQQGTLAGLLRNLADPETAVMLVSYTDSDGVHDTFDRMRRGVHYWVQTYNRDGRIRNRADGIDHMVTHNGVRIAFYFPQQWTYRWDDEDLIATRTSDDGLRVLVLRLTQPNVLRDAYRDSLDPDRIGEQ